MKNKTGLLVGGLAVIIALGAFGYWFVLREPEAPSAEIEAIPLEPEAVEQAEVVENAEDLPDPAVEVSEPEVAEEPEEVVEEPEIAEETDEMIAEEPAPAGGAITWQINSDTATARFELDEDLNGERITVVGVADQVAGQMRFDPADLSSAEVGIIQINARTFVTDNDRRNNAIQNRILQTGEFEFVTFEPTALSGLPASASAGETLEFEIEGNLTVRGTTNPVVFSAVIDYVDANMIEGTAAAIILYSDFGINVPNVPVIANVEEELELYIDFIAVPIE